MSSDRDRSVMPDPPAPNLPAVSIVIPVFNGEAVIGDCLTSLVRSDHASDRLEIVVVDDASTDRTAEIVRRFPVRYVRGSRGGCALARNRGIEASRGEVVAFLDADCFVATSWLEELLRPFEDSEVAGATGEVVAYPPRTPAERYVARRRPRFQQWSAAMPRPWFLVNNSAFRRSVFDRIGAMDPAFSGVGCCEDMDFSWRFFDAGLRLIHCPRAVVLHRHRATVGGLFRQQVRNGRGQARLRAKHGALLPWGWRHELAAWRDLGRGVADVLRHAAREPVRRRSPELEHACLDIVRKFAQRVGFVRATLLEGCRPSWRERTAP